MSKSDYRPIAIRGGIGDIIINSIRTWGNGFWKYFFINFFFIIPVLLVINLFNIFIPNLINLVEVWNSDILIDIKKLNINLMSLIYFFSTLVVLLYFLFLSFGANAFITGKYVIGESPSIANALSSSLKRSGSYLFYTFILIILITGLIVLNRFLKTWIGLELYNNIIDWVLFGETFIIILVLPILISVLPAMIYMRRRIIKAFKGIFSLLKHYYPRILGIIIISFFTMFFVIGLIPPITFSILFADLNLSLPDLPHIISNVTILISHITSDHVVVILIIIFIISMLYSFIATLISYTFMNMWACKLGLENIYAIKILSAALNKRKISKYWYQNKETDTPH